MRLRDAIHLAAVNIFQTPMRSILTVLGLAIGIGAILSVMTLGDAGQQQVEMEMTRMGVDKVWITARGQSSRYLNAGDGLLLRDATGALATAQAHINMPVSSAGETAYAQISGCDEYLSSVQQFTLSDGRFLSRRDQRDGAAVAVIDDSLASVLFKEEAKSCVGRRVSLAGRLYRIVGLVDGVSMQTAGIGMDGTLLIPLSAFSDAFGEEVSDVMLSVPKNVSGNALAKEALAALHETGGSFQATTLQAEIEAARAVVRIFVMVLCCVAVICMLVGGIGVMNILLVSVRERRQEIGVLKALGATGAQVCLLFLLEAAAYAALGGVLGVVAGELIVRLTGGWIGIWAVIQPGLIPLAVGFAMLVGMFFGVAPAWRAARMAPADALKQP
jgi:putative ABC transport system permease protein